MIDDEHSRPTRTNRFFLHPAKKGWIRNTEVYKKGREEGGGGGGGGKEGRRERKKGKEGEEEAGKRGKPAAA